MKLHDVASSTTGHLMCRVVSYKGLDAHLVGPAWNILNRLVHAPTPVDEVAPPAREEVDLAFLRSLSQAHTDRVCIDNFTTISLQDRRPAAALVAPCDFTDRDSRLAPDLDASLDLYHRVVEINDAFHPTTLP